MLFGFIGRVSGAPQLVSALDASAQRRDVIAQRISTASMAPGSGFALPDATATAIDVEQEMTNLANEDVHNEALTRMLHNTYSTLRSIIKDRS
jgi:hypothetical protein